MAEIKAYRPSSTSLSSGQVLHCPYTNEQARLITWEMADQLFFDLVDKRLVTNQIVLDVGYDIDNIARGYIGEVHVDHYGRKVPKAAHGTVSLPKHTSSTKKILQAVVALYDRITNPSLLVRRITVTVGRLIHEDSRENQREQVVEFNLFENMDEVSRKEAAEENAEMREKSLQHALLAIRNRFSKNAILKATNLKEEARTIARNQEVGGA